MKGNSCSDTNCINTRLVHALFFCWVRFLWLWCLKSNSCVCCWYGGWGGGVPSPPASGEKRDTKLLHWQKFTDVLPLWWITLLFFPPVCKWPLYCVYSTWRTVGFWGRALIQVLEKQSILSIHPRPPSSMHALPDIFNLLCFSAPGAPLHSILILFCAFITCWLTPPPTPVLLSFSVLHHTLITSKNQMWRPAVLLLLKSPHNRAQGYLKLSVKTASRSFTPPHRIVMDVLSDCSIWLPYLRRGSISHCTFWVRGECCFCAYGQKVIPSNSREKMEEGVEEV